MKCLKFLLAILLLALAAATAVQAEEEKFPSFLQTNENAGLTNEVQMEIIRDQLTFFLLRSVDLNLSTVNDRDY